MNDETPEHDLFTEPPSKSSRKRAALAAQALGERLVALREEELTALELPERVLDAIHEAQRIRERGGLARQRQYIGRLMRDLDLQLIEATLETRARTSAVDTARLRDLEAWRVRLLREGNAGLDALLAARPRADRLRLAQLVADALSPRATEAARLQASRSLFRALRESFD